jgi:hypothetical protein
MWGGGSKEHPGQRYQPQRVLSAKDRIKFLDATKDFNNSHSRTMLLQNAAK